MTMFKTMAAAAALSLGLSGAVFAQASTGYGDPNTGGPAPGSVYALPHIPSEFSYETELGRQRSEVGYSDQAQYGGAFALSYDDPGQVARPSFGADDAPRAEVEIQQ